MKTVVSGDVSLALVVMASLLYSQETGILLTSNATNSAKVIFRSLGTYPKLGHEQSYQGEPKSSGDKATSGQRCPQIKQIKSGVIFDLFDSPQRRICCLKYLFKYFKYFKSQLPCSPYYYHFQSPTGVHPSLPLPCRASLRHASPSS